MCVKEAENEKSKTRQSDYLVVLKCETFWRGSVMFRIGFFFLLILVGSAQTNSEKGILTPRPPTVHPALSVAGDWDCQFDGTIVERSDGGRVGGSQTDSIVFCLRQSGSTVTGEVVFGEGWPYELRAPPPR